MGGVIGRFIGSKLGKSRAVVKRIESHLVGANGEEVMLGTWDNLGRVLSEYPHLRSIAKHNVHIENPKLIRKIFDQGKPIMFIGGHCANWEAQTMLMYAHYGIGINALYRPPNNPYVDKALRAMRKIDIHTDTIPKSATGAKDLIKAMKEKKSIGFLFDQKFNGGEAIPLLGEEAMSYTSIIPFTQKYDYVLFPFHIKRDSKDPTKFIFRAEYPIDLFNQKGEARSSLAVFTDMHELLEKWIKETPAEWLWLHDRWGKPIPRRLKKKK
jgi:KDO2-lipid IV(A) lauroyltransferase